MKLYTKSACLAIGIAIGLAVFGEGEVRPAEVLPDPIELAFPLVKVKSPYIINDLSYLREDNFLGESFYDKFGISECYVHRDIMPNMVRLAKILAREKVKAVMSDCFRPHEAQIYMWKRQPNPKFLANPYKGGSLHSRGIAVDMALADMDGNKLDFANYIDSFTDDDGHDYVCKKGEEEGCRNRARLKRIMEEAGFQSIKHEWWHYQIPDNWRDYPLIRVCSVVKCKE